MYYIVTTFLLFAILYVLGIMWFLGFIIIYNIIVAIYNTQLSTPIWKYIKKFYVKSPLIIKKILSYFFMLYFSLGLLLFDNQEMIPFIATPVMAPVLAQ